MDITTSSMGAYQCSGLESRNRRGVRGGGGHYITIYLAEYSTPLSKAVQKILSVAFQQMAPYIIRIPTTQDFKTAIWVIYISILGRACNTKLAITSTIPPPLLLLSETLEIETFQYDEVLCNFSANPAFLSNNNNKWAFSY